jgi:GNAT superfamily N-acetyltransferase
MGSVIKPARPDQRFAVLALCRDFHAASPAPFAFDPVHASQSVQGHIEGVGKLCLVNEVDGAVRGILIASAAISPLAPVLFAQELIFWINPAHRRGRVALSMIRSYEAWARAEGCIGAGLSGLNDPRVSRLYAAAGFDLFENKFLKMLG